MIVKGSGDKGFWEILRNGGPVGFDSVKFLGFDSLIRGDDKKTGDLEDAELLSESSASQLVDINAKENEFHEEVLCIGVSIDKLLQVLIGFNPGGVEKDQDRLFSC